MLWFNAAKRHGFIRTDGGERLRVDQEGFAAGEPPGDRCRGTRVRFERAALFAARRARLRGRL